MSESVHSERISSESVHSQHISNRSAPMYTDEYQFPTHCGQSSKTSSEDGHQNALYEIFKMSLAAHTAIKIAVLQVGIQWIHVDSLITDALWVHMDTRRSIIDPLCLQEELRLLQCLLLFLTLTRIRAWSMCLCQGRARIGIIGPRGGCGLRLC